MHSTDNVQTVTYGRVQGTLKAPIKAICLRISFIFLALFTYFLECFGPIRAHVGPYGPIWARPGPLKSGKIKKTYLFYVTYYSQKTSFFNLQTMFFHSFNVCFRFLAEIHLRTLIKSPQKQVLDPKHANSVPPAPCLKLQSALCVGGTRFFPTM